MRASVSISTSSASSAASFSLASFTRSALPPRASSASLPLRLRRLERTTSSANSPGFTPKQRVMRSARRWRITTRLAASRTSFATWVSCGLAKRCSIKRFTISQ